MDTALRVEARRQSMAASGLWQDKTLLDYLRHWASVTPDKTAVVGFCSNPETRLS